MTNDKRQKNYYFPEDMVKIELQNYKIEIENPNLSCEAKPSDFLENTCYNLIEHVMTNRRFKKYDSDTKDEMRQFAKRKIIRAMALYDQTLGFKAFSYFTKTIWLSFLKAIDKRNKRLSKINLKDNNHEIK